MLDNPVMQDHVTLGERSDGAGHFSHESVSTGPQGTVYTNFFLQLYVDGGNPALGAVNEAIPILPYDNAPYDAGDVMFWDARGIELGYGFSVLQGENVDAFFNVTDTPLISPSYELDPTVMLVPVQMIRVLPRDPSSSAYPYVWNVTKRAYKTVWDDQLLINSFHESAPYYPNDLTADSWSEDTPSNLPASLQQPEYRAYQAYLGHTMRPDLIWNQCGIQFREINCPGAADNGGMGCPDLVVDDDAHVGANNDDCEAGDNFPHVREDWASAQSLPGVTDNFPIVTAMWNVSGPCIVNGTEATAVEVATTGFAALSLSPQAVGSAPYVLAHEMGHVLGLNDDFSCDSNHQHLMCSNPTFQAPLIRSEDCVLARDNAAQYVKIKWGVTVNP